MSLNHSEETHRNLVARVPERPDENSQSGSGPSKRGPAFLRFDDRVRWLRDEHGLAHGHATAIVHEHDLRRARRSFE